VDRVDAINGGVNLVISPAFNFVDFHAHFILPAHNEAGGARVRVVWRHGRQTAFVAHHGTRLRKSAICPNHGEAFLRLLIIDRFSEN
jgi:hypothetical protein